MPPTKKPQASLPKPPRESGVAAPGDTRQDALWRCSPAGGPPQLVFVQVVNGQHLPPLSQNLLLLLPLCLSLPTFTLRLERRRSRGGTREALPSLHPQAWQGDRPACSRAHAHLPAAHPGQQRPASPETLHPPPTSSPAHCPPQAPQRRGEGPEDQNLPRPAQRDSGRRAPEKDRRGDRQREGQGQSGDMEDRRQPPQAGGARANCQQGPA